MIFSIEIEYKIGIYGSMIFFHTNINSIHNVVNVETNHMVLIEWQMSVSRDQKLMELMQLHFILLHIAMRILWALYSHLGIKRTQPSSQVSLHPMGVYVSIHCAFQAMDLSIYPDF